MMMIQALPLYIIFVRRTKTNRSPFFAWPATGNLVLGPLRRRTPRAVTSAYCGVASGLDGWIFGAVTFSLGTDGGAACGSAGAGWDAIGAAGIGADLGEGPSRARARPGCPRVPGSKKMGLETS